jgi:hypothetical protein
MKENFKRILVEVPTIVLSVIIALAINQWNTVREREQLATNVMMTIREELAFNSDQVKRAYEYHRPLVKDLKSGEHRMFSIPRTVLSMSEISPRLLENSLSELLVRFGEPVNGPLGVKRSNDSLFTFQFKQQLLTIRVTKDSLKVYGKGNISLHSALVRNNAWRIAQAAQIAPYLDFSLIALMSEVDQLHTEYEKTTGRIVEMLYRGGSDVTPAMEDLLYFESALLKKYSELDSLLNH